MLNLILFSCIFFHFVLNLIPDRSITNRSPTSQWHHHPCWPTQWPYTMYILTNHLQPPTSYWPTTNQRPTVHQSQTRKQPASEHPSLGVKAFPDPRRVACVHRAMEVRRVGKTTSPLHSSSGPPLVIECSPSDAHINAIFAFIISSLFRLSAAEAAVSTSRRVPASSSAAGTERVVDIVDWLCALRHKRRETRETPSVRPSSPTFKANAPFGDEGRLGPASTEKEAGGCPAYACPIST